jgi:deoxyguanosine kinase
MFYLINRWRQQNKIRQQDLFSDLVVSDYLMEKDRMFAEKTLPGDELELYDRFAGALSESNPKPDLLIFLDAPTDVIMHRIARRQAPGEQAIKAAYLDDLRDRYRKLLSSWTRCPVLRLDNRDMNYADDEGAQARLLSWIDAALEGGKLPPEAPGSISDREDQPSLFGRGSP